MREDNVSIFLKYLESLFIYRLMEKSNFSSNNIAKSEKNNTCVAYFTSPIFFIKFIKRDNIYYMFRFFYIL